MKRAFFFKDLRYNAVMKMPRTKVHKKSARRFKKPVKKTKMTKETILQSIRTNIQKPVTTKIKSAPKKRTTLVSTLKPGLVRLEKYMAQSGLTSRREAKDFVQRGLVTVNGKVAREPGVGIDITKDVVKINGGVLESKETILFYKPRGIETTKTSPENTDIHDRFPKFAHLSPVGRLDKDSEGLILLSNDGVLTKLITGENSTTEKEYRVSTREDVMPAMLDRMERGIKLDGTMTKPCKTKKTGKDEFTIILTEGRKHQVRRMANACKLTVRRLTRIRIGNLIIGKMTAGNFKRLPDEAITELKKK